MPGQQDYYPQKKADMPEWYQNFLAQLTLLQAKYGITNAQRSEIQADNDWIQYWIPAMFAIEQQKDAMNAYFDTILKGAEGSPSPSPVVIALPGGVPAEILPGARERVRDIARFIKGNPDYNPADGEALGIVASKETPQAPGSMTATFSVRTLAGFALEVTFTKQGQSAMRFEIRHKGGDWTFVTVLTTSPGTFAVTPATAGVAEQIEIRSILIEKNESVGNYSDTKNAFIAP